LHPSYAAALSEAQLKKCNSIQRMEIIRAATASIIEMGSREKKHGIPDSENMWPYDSFADMIKRHPDCCSISTKFVGDYDPRIRSHFDGGSSFRAYFVRIRLPSVVEVGKHFIKTQYDRVVIVTCFGQAVTEEQLINMAE
jgi:hypothetical protein